MARQNKLCQWWQDDDEGMWESPCGVAFQFNDGTPYQNGMRYCFKCGKPMFKSVAPKNMEAGRTVARVRAVQQRKGRNLPDTNCGLKPIYGKYTPVA